MSYGRAPRAVVLGAALALLMAVTPALYGPGLVRLDRAFPRDGRLLMEETAALVTSERSSALERPCCLVCRGS